MYVDLLSHFFQDKNLVLIHVDLEKSYLSRTSEAYILE